MCTSQREAQKGELENRRVENSQRECPVCLNIFGEDAVQLPCEHLICRECLAALRTSTIRNVCPLCRHPLPREEVSAIEVMGRATRTYWRTLSLQFRVELQSRTPLMRIITANDVCARLHHMLSFLAMVFFAVLFSAMISWTVPATVSAGKTCLGNSTMHSSPNCWCSHANGTETSSCIELLQPLTKGQIVHVSVVAVLTVVMCCLPVNMVLRKVGSGISPRLFTHVGYWYLLLALVVLLTVGAGVGSAVLMTLVLSTYQRRMSCVFSLLALVFDGLLMATHSLLLGAGHAGVEVITGHGVSLMQMFEGGSTSAEIWRGCWMRILRHYDVEVEVDPEINPYEQGGEAHPMASELTADEVVGGSNSVEHRNDHVHGNSTTVHVEMDDVELVDEADIPTASTAVEPVPALQALDPDPQVQ